MKRNSILLVTIGLILIIVGNLWFYLKNSYRNDNLIKDKMEVVIKNYDKFQENISLVNGERQIINNEVVNNYLEENVSSNYDSWFDKFRIYEKSIKNIYNYEDMILKNCVLEKYKNTDVVSKCDSMIISYETVINYFVKDVETLNKFLELYNLNYPNDEKTLYLTDFKYIDINDDGKYLGK